MLWQYRPLGLAFLGAAVLVSATRAADDGFTPIFNGKDLTGWHKNPQRIGHGTGGRWFIEDGAIVGEQDPPGSGNGGILLTDKKYGDCEILFECKPDWGVYDGKAGGVCSGFFLRCNEKGQCYQVMIDYHDGGNVGEIYGEGVGGFTNRTFSLQGVYNKSGDIVRLVGIEAKAVGDAPSLFSRENWTKIWKMGDWNEVRARIVGEPPRIQTWINGQAITDFQGKEPVAALGREGSIAVQVHGGNGWPKGARTRFRNLRVKPL